MTSGPLPGRTGRTITTHGWTADQPPDLPSKLIEALQGGTWRHRDELALCLGVSVRQVREAASQSRGQVLSGQLGLRLTVCATPEEVEEAIGRARSQVSEMTRRIVETVAVFERRVDGQKSA